MAATAGRPALARAVQHGSSSSAAAATAFAATAAAVSFAAGGVLADSDERSFIMVKPDGVQRGMVAEIIKRFEAKGYKLVGIKVIVPSKDLAGRHYEEHKERPFFPKLVNFLSSGAVVAMVWEGTGVVKYGRTMIGATNPLASEPGTIRGDFGIDVGRNIIHGSDSVESAQREMALWFLPHELADYEFANKAWIYE